MSVPMKKLRIATRKSALALWQANYVADALRQIHPNLDVSLVKLVSQGDKLLETPLAKIGGKGLFVKELERALLNDEADIAVHSMKDVPMTLPEMLSLPVICEREDPRDAFISNSFASIDELPVGAVVGTSSLRRQCQLLERRPDLTVRFLRGNVNTRLAKLDAGEYDAIILASAGLIRLGLQSRIVEYITVEQSLPAAGQGAVGIEICTHRVDVLQLIHPLHHQQTAYCVEAERSVNRHLNGSCQVPIASFATLEENKLHLNALVGQPDASIMLRTQVQSEPIACQQLGKVAADDLLKQGAGDILSALAHF